MHTARRRLLPADQIDSSTEVDIDHGMFKELKQQYAVFLCGAGHYYTDSIAEIRTKRKLLCCCFWTSTVELINIKPPFLGHILESGISCEAFFANEKMAFEAARKKHPNRALTILTVNIEPLEKNSQKMIPIKLENITKVVEYKTRETDYDKYIELKLPVSKNVPSLVTHFKMA